MAPVPTLHLKLFETGFHDVGGASRRLVSQVDGERCLGCGVCVGACRDGALALEERTRAPHVPLNPIEFLTRRVLERGRLADLIIDWTSGRGPSFANAVLTAVFALPPAKRLLADERLQSRFVCYALSHYDVPMERTGPA